jgi:UDP-glucose 4-epimerase
MRALVTGAAGFIASTLVDRLLTDGHQVVGVDNFSTGISANLEQALDYNLRSSRFSLVQLDIQAPELVDVVAGTNPHVVFHLAAQVDVGTSVSDPLFDARSNVLGTINLCEASRQSGVRRIIYAGSGESRYVAQAGPPVDEDVSAEPLSPHAVAKFAGELYLCAYAEMHGLTPICLALANVYGPRQNPHGAAGVIAAIASAMITGRPYTVYRNRSAAHDYVYVDDVVDAFICASEAPPEKTGIYNIGSGQRTTVTEVYRLISAVLDRASLSADADADQWCTTALDDRKVEAELGWVPKVPLAEGIRRTVDWLCATLEPEQPVQATA